MLKQVRLILVARRFPRQVTSSAGNWSGLQRRGWLIFLFVLSIMAWCLRIDVRRMRNLRRWWGWQAEQIELVEGRGRRVEAAVGAEQSELVEAAGVGLAVCQAGSEVAAAQERSQAGWAARSSGVDVGAGQ